MKAKSLFGSLAAVLCVLLIANSSHAATVSFGSGLNNFNMEFVEIGSPGNIADTTGFPNPAGTVNYYYNIGKFEVSRGMVNKANAEGMLNVTQSDMSSFGVNANGNDYPANGVSWNEAARFVNWLNISQGYSPAYKFSFQPGEVGYSSNSNFLLWSSSDAGFNPANPYRNSNAKYYLPSVNEWYKAAYYDPMNGNYYKYATGSNLAPTLVSSGTTPGTAVYNSAQGPAEVMLAGGLSPFGTMGQGGNVSEWQETASSNFLTLERYTRGGSFDSNPVSSLGYGTTVPNNQGAFTGFRVASLSAIPEPNTYALLITSLTVLGWTRWRRRSK